MTRRMSLLAVVALCGCFGLLGGGGKFHKVNIYPSAQTWSQLEAGAKQLGWKAEPHSGGYDLKVWADGGKELFMDDAPNTCAVSGDQHGHGCAGLRYTCDGDTKVEDCTKRFMTLAQASGIDPSTLKVSNNMARTDDGKPYQP